MNATHGRVLKSEEDLALLLRVYRTQHKYQEALSICEDKRTGIASPIAYRSWSIVRQMVELYGMCEKWDLQWHTCKEVLEHACSKASTRTPPDSKFAFGELGDDWTIWDGLVTACVKLATEE